MSKYPWARYWTPKLLLVLQSAPCVEASAISKCPVMSPRLTLPSPIDITGIGSINPCDTLKSGIEVVTSLRLSWISGRWWDETVKLVPEDDFIFYILQCGTSHTVAGWVKTCTVTMFKMEQDVESQVLNWFFKKLFFLDRRYIYNIYVFF